MTPTKYISCSPRALSGSEVDFDVDEDHDGGGDIERAEGGIHHVAQVLAQLERGTDEINQVKEDVDFTGYAT